GVSANQYIGKPYDTAHVISAARALVSQTAGRSPVTQTTAPTIVIIDDSVTYREELGAAIIAAGYRPIQATNGEDGLRLVATHRPAAVLVDGVLPGIGGPTVIRRI